MSFKIEKYIIRMGTRYLRRCFSQNVNASNESQEFVLQANNDFKLIHQENQKALKIAMLGAPNVGKSTIINQLIKRSICPSSSKAHTTQTKARAIYCEDNTQLIFMDTPGMVSESECKRFQLSSTFRNDPKRCLQTSDIIGIVQDAHNIYTRNKIDPNILELLNKDIRNKIPLILIFNKVDKLKKKEVLLHLANVLSNGKNSLNFCDIFMISALTGDGIDDLRSYLLDSAKPQDWQYEEHICSDHTYEEIIKQTIRAKLMDNLPNEIPYKLNVKLEHFDVAIADNIKIIVSVICPKKRIMALLLRNGGKKIKIIARTAEEELRNAFRTVVKLKITVQCS